jgi:hypothetical protein
MFGETLLVVEQVQSFLERCSHLDLALVSSSVVGRPEGQSAIPGALVAALVMARHERVVVIQGQTLAEGETEIEIDRICRTLATEEVDVVLPPSGSFCPGGYRRSCSRPLERALQRGRHAPDAALKGLRLFKLG